MEKIDYNSPLFLRDFLVKQGLGMQKRFGQNFLVNPATRQKLVSVLDIKKNSVVWEVGPGVGSVTSLLLESGAKLKAFEIDKSFAKINRELFSCYGKNFSLVEGDFLKTYRGQEQMPQRFFGNLPYNIAQKIIVDTIKNGFIFEKCVLMLQKEVAKRLVATPKSSDYSFFSVVCGGVYKSKILFSLAPGNFWPAPNVDSSAVLLEKKQDCFDSKKQIKIFIDLVHGAFLSRRKTLANNLKNYTSEYFTLRGQNIQELLQRCDILPDARAQSLDIDKFLALCKIVSYKIVSKDA